MQQWGGLGAGVALFALTLTEAQAGPLCGRGRYGFSGPTGRRAAAAPAGAGTIVVPTPASTAERYFYQTPTAPSALGSPAIHAPAPVYTAPTAVSPRAWQPGDPTPGFTHTNE